MFALIKKPFCLEAFARIFIAGQEGRIRKYWSLLVVISFILYDEFINGWAAANLP